MAGDAQHKSRVGPSDRSISRGRLVGTTGCRSVTRPSGPQQPEQSILADSTQGPNRGTADVGVRILRCGNEGIPRADVTQSAEG